MSPDIWAAIRPDRPWAAKRTRKRRGAGDAKGDDVASVRAAAMAACAAQLKCSGSNSRLGAARGRAGRWRCRRAPGAHHGGEGNGRGGKQAHAAAPGLQGPSPEPPQPQPALRRPPRPHLPSCSGIFSSDTAFKMAAPPPGNPFNRPLQQAPSRRHLVPRPSPPRRYLHSENRPGRPAAFTSRLQPSPPGQASPSRGAPRRPRRRPAASQSPPRPPGDPPPTRARSLSAPPPQLGAAGLLPGPNCGLLGAWSAPRATPPGLARKGALRAADQAGTRPLHAR